MRPIGMKIGISFEVYKENFKNEQIISRKFKTEDYRYETEKNTQVMSSRIPRMRGMRDLDGGWIPKG